MDDDFKKIAETLFPLLVDPPPQRPPHVFDTLLNKSDPESILHVALGMTYRKESSLLLADSLIHRFEERGWKALEEVSYLSDDRCLPFLDSIIECPVDEKIKVEALQRLTKNPDPTVRWEVLSKAYMMPQPRSIIEILKADEDEDIRRAAEKELAYWDSKWPR
jgi:hypothetical protein